MAKGPCSGVGQSHEKENERERERPIFLGMHGKPTKLLHRACTTHKGTRHPLGEALKARVGK